MRSRLFILLFFIAIVSFGLFILPSLTPQYAEAPARPDVLNTSTSTQQKIAASESTPSDEASPEHVVQDTSTTKRPVVQEPTTTTEAASSQSEQQTQLAQANEASPDMSATINAQILAATNNERVKAGLAPLSSNTLLNKSALQKAVDILARQYFEHTDPDGKGAIDIAKSYGYKPLLVGENLALGYYDNGQEIVDAWMGSPGHRANILRGDFEEIGIAAVEGVFKGERAWVAVQVFGRPLSACPQPNVALKEKIELYRSQVESLDAALTRIRTTLEAANPKSGSVYLQEVENYNSTVAFTQKLADELNVYVSQYNAQVQVFNSCLNK